MAPYYFIGLLLCALSILPVQNSRAETVEDLAYGVALYHFFQQEYVASLNELMVAEQQQDLQNHLVNAELLKGGMSLAYGLDKQTEAIFTRLLSEGSDAHLSLAESNRAWFYLGKLIYQHGDYTRALKALSHIDPYLRKASFWRKTRLDINYNEAQFIKANILLKQGNIMAAKEAMSAVEPQSLYWPYYYFNLGSLLTAKGDWLSAIDAFNEINLLRIYEPELAVLRDRANTAVAYAYLANNQANKAVAAFEHVNLDTPFVDEALLGYGLALSEVEQYDQAIIPWQVLLQRSLLLPAVQEAHLALPYAYEKQNKLSASLRAYKNAVASYKQEIHKLDDSIAAFKQKSLDALFLLDQQSNNELNIIEVPQTDKETFYLSQLIAQHRFQTALNDYRDVQFLMNNLADSAKKIALLRTVDDAQRVHWQVLVEEGQFEAYRLRKQQLKALRQVLFERITIAEADLSGQAFAHGEQYELWRIVNSAEAGIKRLSDSGEDVSYEQEQLTRYKGLLLWQSSETYINNRWQLTKQLADVDKQLALLDKTLANVGGAIAGKETSVFEPKIVALENSINYKQAQLLALSLATETEIRQTAIAHLQSQKQQLRVYLSKATLAIARIYDEVVSNQVLAEPEPVAPPQLEETQVLSRKALPTAKEEQQEQAEVSGE